VNQSKEEQNWREIDIFKISNRNRKKNKLKKKNKEGGTGLQGLSDSESGVSTKGCGSNKNSKNWN